MKRIYKRTVVLILLCAIDQPIAHGKENTNEDLISNLISIAHKAFILCGSFALYKHYCIIENGGVGGYQARSKYKEIDKLRSGLDLLEATFKSQENKKQSEISQTMQELLTQQNGTSESDDLNKMHQKQIADFQTLKTQNSKVIESTKKELQSTIEESNRLARQFEEEKGWQHIQTHMNPMPLFGVLCLISGIYLKR